MFKKVASVICSFAMAVSLAACASPQPEPETGADAGTPDTQIEDKVVVYSTHPEKLLTRVADEFTAETGIEVEFINLKGELADRVRSEMGNPQADVMYGGDTSVYMKLAEEGAYQVTTPSWADELSNDFKATDGSWYGTIKTPVMMFYNTTLLDSDTAPKDWGDLTDTKYASQVISRDYLSSSMRSAICNLTYYYTQEGGSDAATEYLQGLNANTKNYYNSGSMMFKAIGNGEAAIGISTLSDIIDNKTNNAMPLQEVNAASGNVVLTDCVAALSGAKHPNAAAAFVDFVGKKQTQVILANEFNRMPVLESAILEAPAWMQTEMSTLPADWSDIAANQTTWLENWQNTIYSDDKTIAGS